MGKTMGNVCGCVRDPKDECYLDPTKAPFNPTPKQLRGRRYFQRKKGRKSGEFQTETFKRTENGYEKNEEFIDSPFQVSQKQDNAESSTARLDSISHGVYVGNILVENKSVKHSERPRTQSSIEQNFHRVTKHSECIASKDSLLKKRPIHLRRSVSFSSVEQMLGKSISNQSFLNQLSEETKGLSWLKCDAQVHKKRRRGYTTPCRAVSYDFLNFVQKELAYPKHSEVNNCLIIRLCIFLLFPLRSYLQIQTVE